MNSFGRIASFVLISGSLFACAQVGEDAVHTITIAYVTEELPGSEFSINLLQSIIDQVALDEDLEIKLIEKIYPNEFALSDALHQDKSITVALLPDRIFSQHEAAILTPLRASGLIEDMGQWAEHGSPVFLQRLKSLYFNEVQNNNANNDNPTLLEKIIPYSFNHYGFLFPSGSANQDFRTLGQIFTAYPLAQIYHDGSLGGLTYLYNRYRYQQEISQAFDDVTAEVLTLTQWQSLVNLYTNVEDAFAKEWILNEADNPAKHYQNHDSLATGVAFIKGHLASKAYLHEQINNQYRFEYPRDGALFYFDAFAFFNRQPTTIDYRFLDGLFDPEVALAALQQTHKWPGLGSNQWLNELQSLLTPVPNQFYQVDLSYLFSQFTTNNRIINFNSQSIWYGLVSNENIFTQSTTVYPQVHRQLYGEFLNREIGWQRLLRSPYIYGWFALPILLGIGFYLLRVHQGRALHAPPSSHQTKQLYRRNKEKLRRKTK